MIANQRLIASDGYEVMLFPLPYLYMTQDEGGNYSHGGTKNIDLVGWGVGGRIYQAPMYAPATARCVAIWDSNSNNRVWETINPVHTPSGLTKITFATAHDDSPPTVGTIKIQGEVFAHTGTTGNVTGDHSHYNIATGEYLGYQSHIYQGNTNYDLINSISVWNGCYVNDTVIIQGYNHNWQIFEGGTPVPPTPSDKHKFPWVLYARKFRNNRY